MSLLTIIRSVCDEINVSRPTTVISTTDQQIRQLLRLANKEGKELAARHQWQALNLEATHTTVAAELQGVLTTIAPGYKSFLNETIWNRSQNVPIQPVTPAEWQQMKSSSVSGPYPKFRIRNKSIYAYPVPTAGHTWVFEYTSENWCQDDAATTTYAAWNADDDIGILDEELMTLGIIWRWMKRKGFDYAEDFNTYERRVEDAITKDKISPRLVFGQRGAQFLDERSIQEGGWSL